jgi:hypothetical protein
MCNPENIRGSGDKLVSKLSIICHLLEAQKWEPVKAEAPTFRQLGPLGGAADFTDS